MQSPGEKSAGLAEHQIEPPGQRPADRLVGLAAHEYRLTERQRLEVAQIRGQPPRQLVAAPDDIVLGSRDHDLHAHAEARGRHLALAQDPAGELLQVLALAVLGTMQQHVALVGGELLRRRA